jgi:methanogenic corrinoid protein MtbC1
MSREGASMSPGWIGIGAVSEATGIAISTLRTWERRYGWPRPRRSEGRQRLYPPDVVDRLRLVSRALAAGHRPAQILVMEDTDLEALVWSTAPVERGDWIAMVRALDSEGLQRAFRVEAATLGIVAFLDERAGPFLHSVGDAWADGTLQTFHEHFASEQLRDFLAPIWRPLAAGQGGPVAVVATLPGEAHGLGLHMAATVLALRAWRVLFLGPDTPSGDLLDAVAQSGARGLFVGVSASTRRAVARKALAALRRRIPADVLMMVGGTGAPAGIDGVDVAVRLADIPFAVRS